MDGLEPKALEASGSVDGPEPSRGFSRALPNLARTLRVTTDVPLAVEPLPDVPRAKTARLMKRLQQVEALPPADQRAVLKVVDALLASRGRAKAARARPPALQHTKKHQGAYS